MGSSIKNIDIAYPNLKQGGVYCLAPLIFYNIANNTKNWNCNLVYLDEGNLRSRLIGFTLQYELDYYNVFDMLNKNRIPLSRSRKQIVFAGGPVINNNPHTMEDFFDFLVLGEGEEIFPKILKIYESSKSKDDFLRKISAERGVYVPGINEPSYSYSDNLDDLPYPLEQPLPKDAHNTRKYVFGESFILEIERGCPFMCKFCPMPSFYQKVKHRSLEKIKEIVDAGIRINKRTKVVIYSASFVHPERKRILKYLLSKNLSFSVPSLKAELVDQELMSLIARGGQKTITLAPECNERLRKKIAKMTGDRAFLDAVKYANNSGIRHLKLYFMIGLPGQARKDLEETVKLIKKLKTEFAGRTYVSVNPFVPKPNTAFAGHKFDKSEIKQQAKFLKTELSKLNIRHKIASIATAEKIWKIAHAKTFEFTGGTGRK